MVAYLVIQKMYWQKNKLFLFAQRVENVLSGWMSNVASVAVWWDVDKKKLTKMVSKVENNGLKRERRERKRYVVQRGLEGGWEVFFF